VCRELRAESTGKNKVFISSVEVEVVGLRVCELAQGQALPFGGLWDYRDTSIIRNRRFCSCAAKLCAESMGKDKVHSFGLGR